ncbi:MAG: HAD-IA family hydrolase [Pseudotabrizicola sp.]|uniref:HAD-IA family hydrolase n=1 Tax=Pseudotabrizicola sp. TaxID=2939647 RepID=UPI00271B0D06|nr:HAD-IA family hydrolase [Pseudotabrizicola sp.]MDO9638164.1 HAD-IA family hydrolase [Pseudotabrizicola sp.]
MTKPEAVVFDIGNVLMHWNPEGFYDRRLGEAGRQRLFAETGIEAMNLAVDAGAPFRATVEAHAEAHPEWREHILCWYHNWIEMAAPRIEGSIALLRALRAKGIPVLALTNFGDDSFTYAQTQYDFMNEFDHAFVSGRMGVIKPDAGIYQQLEEAMGIVPERLIFTDDKAENIAAAAARGWRVHHFTGWQGWALRLVDEGLLTTAEAGL